MRAFWYFCTVLLLILPINSWSVTEINLSRSQLALLASNLETASNDQQFEFARIALSQLYAVYEKELHRSKSERPSKPKKIRKLYRWRKATSDYLYEIDDVLSHLLVGYNFSFYVNKQDRIIISVSGKALMISGLNYSTDRSLEINILNEFCRLYDCQSYLSEQGEQYVQYSEPTVNGFWLMDKSHKADFFTHSGITYRFADLTNREKKQEWAISLTQELLFLVKTLELTEKRGYKISPHAITVEKAVTSEGNIKVTLNDKGEFVNISAPIIRKSTEIFSQLKPWIVNAQLNKDESDLAIIIKSEKHHTDAY